MATKSPSVNGKNRIAEIEQPAPKAAKHIVLQQLKIETIQLTVIGTSPLITHAWSKKAMQMIEDKQQKKGTQGRLAKVPEEEFKAAIYRTEEGEPGIPAMAFKHAMVAACSSLKGQITKTLVLQALHIDGHILPIKGPKPRMRQDMVRVGKFPNQTADIRYRPEFMPWSVTLNIRFNTNAISADQIANLLETAGFSVGLGEWRPEKKGSWGTFEVKKG